MKIILPLVSLSLLLLLGCKEKAGSEVQKIFAGELLLSPNEMVGFSEIVESEPQIPAAMNPEFEVMSGKEFVKLTKDKKIVALKNGQAQLKNKRNGDLYHLKIDSNDLGTKFLNIAFIDLYSGLVLTEDVPLTVGHHYALGMSSRFPLKQNDVKLKTPMGKLVQQDALGNIFLTPTEENLQDKEEELLIQIQVNGREYAKYFKIQQKQLSGSKLITDPQKRFLPVGAKVSPLVSYINADGKVHPVRAELLTYVIEGQKLSLAELHDFLSNPRNIGRHEILVKHPNIVETASLNYEIVTLGDFVTMFETTVNLPSLPEVLQAHIDVPYRLLITSNGVDVTSLVEIEVSPDGAGRIEDGFLIMSENALVSVSINGSKLSSYLPHQPDYYKVKVDNTDLRLNLNVADSLYTRRDKGLPVRLLLNDVNVTNRNLEVEFINSNGEKVPGSKGKKAWSTCNLSFSEPRAMVLFDDKIYGVPGNQTHESLFTFDCRERDYINPIQAIDFVAISSMGSNEIINRSGAPSLKHIEVNGVYRISY